MLIRQINDVKLIQQWDNEELATALGVGIHAVWAWLASRRRPRPAAKRLLDLLTDFPELGPTLLRLGRKKARSASQRA